MVSHDWNQSEVVAVASAAPLRCRQLPHSVAVAVAVAAAASTHFSVTCATISSRESGIVDVLIQDQV